MADATASGSSRGRLLTGGENYREGNDRPPRRVDQSNKYHPYSVKEACEGLAPQATFLATAARQIDESLRGERVVFEATMLPNYLAGMYHPADLLQDYDIRSLGSRTSWRDLVTAKSATQEVLTKTLILAASVASLDALAAEVESGAIAPADVPHGERLRQFDSLGLPSREALVRIPSEDEQERIWPDAWEVVLHPDPDHAGSGPLSERTFLKFESLVQELGGTVLSDWRDYVDGMTFVPVELSEDRVYDLAAFNPLRSVSPMARISEPSGILRRYQPDKPLPAPEGPAAEERPTVLVFDGGVDLPSPYFDQYVELYEATGEPPEPDQVAHGTAVTATVLYGLVEEGAQLDPPPVNVRHYRVMPSNGDITEMYDLLEKITGVIEGLPPGQIVNLSIGPQYAMVDDTVHLWTLKLDDLATRKDCLFVVAAGNNGNDDAASGLNRVQAPADMVNGISVGACAHRVRPGKPVERARYSAVGPGRAGARVQPTGVAFGGSPTEPFMRLAGDGSFTYDKGTSYAAPQVAHGIGKLAAELGPDRSATLMRALAIHCADAVGPYREFGWGTFSLDYHEVLDYPTNEVTVLSALNVTRFGLHTLPIPFPTVEVPGRIGLKYTVALEAATDPREALDYTKVGLNVNLRPHSGRKAMTHPTTDTGQVVDIVHEPDRYRQLLREGWKESAHPENRSSKLAGALELSRRELGGKWETVIKLEDSMLARSLYRPRLDLDLISREGGAITRPRDEVKVSVITSLVARADVDLYGLVVEEFTQLSVLPTRVRATT